MKYLIRKLKSKTKHIWTGYDIACRMYSTGGLKKKKYEVVDSSDLPVCTMCQNVDNAFHGIKKQSNAFDPAKQFGEFMQINGK